MFYQLLFSIEIFDREHVPCTGAVILAPTHLSIHIGIPLDIQADRQLSPKQASTQLHQDLIRSLEYLMTR